MDPRYAFGPARDARAIAQAKLLRYRVLEDELEAELPAYLKRIAEERFDEHCEHLVVMDTLRDEVVGACRVLPPEGARRTAGFHIEQRFDLHLLEVLRHRMVEVERPCIEPVHPASSITALLWAALADYLIERGHDYVIGAANLPIADGGDLAASIYRRACATHMSPDDYRVFPRRRLPIETLRDTMPVTTPAPLRGFLNLGAWVCGEPAWDVETGCADVPVLLPLARMQVRHARHFLIRAA